MGEGRTTPLIQTLPRPLLRAPLTAKVRFKRVRQARGSEKAKTKRTRQKKRYTHTTQEGQRCRREDGDSKPLNQCVWSMRGRTWGVPSTRFVSPARKGAGLAGLRLPRATNSTAH